MFYHTCHQCKNQFITERRKSKYCSTSCKHLGLRKFKNCLFCKQDFCNWRNKKYCSENCQNNHKRTDLFKYERLLKIFNSRVIKKEDNCWDWNGPVDRQGYGNIYYKNRMTASRASWIIHNGLIPNNLHVLHRCDNPPCTKPDHLFLGTPKDNAQDMMQKGRGNKKFGSDIGNSKLNANQIIEIRNRLSNNEKPINIAKLYNISRRTISAIKIRKIWNHI